MIHEPSRHNPATLTERVTQDLRRQIEHGVLSPGSRLASAAALCAAYSVSNITVRAAVRELTRLGYLESHGRAGVFVKRAGEAASAVGSDRTIGLVLGHVNHPFYSAQLATIERTCREAGYGLKVVGAEADAALAVGQLKRLAAEVAGLIIDPTPDPPAYSAYGVLLDQRLPFVFVNRYIDGLDVPTVSTDNEQGGYLMGRHLFATGCVTVCVFQDYQDTAARDRVEGCRRALREMGAEPMVKVSTVYAETGGYLMTRELLQDTTLDRHGRLGIFALNQQLARGSMIALSEAGRHVPVDVALGGFDDTYAVFFDPPLTTINQDMAGIGKRAVELLLKQIGGATIPPGRRLHFLQPELVVRNSTDLQSGFSMRNYLLEGELGSTIEKPDGKDIAAM